MGASAGDAFVDVTDTEIDLDSTFLAFGRADPGGDQNPTHAGVRFTTMVIPQGSTILSAVLRVVASDTVSAGVVNALVYGHDSDSAAAFSTYADFMGRPRTSASVAWAAIAAWTTGTSYDSPDLTAIIQEIVSRPGWVSGNAMVLFVQNNSSTLGAYREFAAYDHAVFAAAQLLVTWA